MSEDLKILAVDGIRRSYDEHYDTMMDVEQDPTGAWQAIQKQADRIEKLEAKLAKAVTALGFYGRWSDGSGGICAFDGGSLASTTLAELKGQDDE